MLKSKTVRTLWILAAIPLVAVVGCQQSSSCCNNKTTTEKPAENAVVQGEPAGAASEQTNSSDATTSPDTRVIAYYFHRTMRCPTCLSIEKQAREAVQIGYGKELEGGEVAWHAVNIEETGQEHFEKDFKLTASSLVLVEMKGPEVIRWKNLEKVWELVEDGPAFQNYVWAELAGFLGT